MADSGDSAATIAAAREREKRLRSITRTAPDAIVIIDETGTIDTVNPAAERLFGYSGAELVGQNVKILMPSPHREAHDSHLARYRETGEKRVIGIGRVVVGRRKDGTTFPARLAIGEIELDQGGSSPASSTTSPSGRPSSGAPASSSRSSCTPHDSPPWARWRRGSRTS